MESSQSAGSRTVLRHGTMTRQHRDGLASGPWSATASPGWATMKGVLGRRETAGEERFDRIGRPVEQQRQLFGLGPGEIPQHIGGRIHPAGGPANADPHPVVVAGTQVGGHRPKAVVPAVAAAAFEPDVAERKVQLVVDHDYLAKAEPVVPADPAHGYARLIHERERLDDDHTVPSQAAFGGQRPELAGPEPRPGPLGKHVGGHKSGIVPVAGVAGPGVAEPSDQPPLSVHLRAPGSRAAGLAAPRLPLAAFSSVNTLSEVASLLGLARDCLGPPLTIPAPYYRALFAAKPQ